MGTREREPEPEENRLNREGMDPGTPHGHAQILFDEMVDVSVNNGGIPVQYNAAGEPMEPFQPPIIPPDDLKITIANNPTDTQKGTTPVENTGKPIKTHDIRGLTGFWRGTLYRNGIPQSPKNRRRK